MTITSEELGNLRGLIKFAAPLPWKWATSNSMARLSSASGKDGDVIHAFRASDGIPCVNVTSDNMNLIASAVNYLPELLAHIDAQSARIAELETERNSLLKKTAMGMGVGDGGGNLFVYGDYDSIKAAQRIVFRAEAAEKELAALADVAGGNAARVKELERELAALRAPKPEDKC